MKTTAMALICFLIYSGGNFSVTIAGEKNVEQDTSKAMDQSEFQGVPLSDLIKRQELEKDEHRKLAIANYLDHFGEPKTLDDITLIEKSMEAGGLARERALNWTARIKDPVLAKPTADLVERRLKKMRKMDSEERLHLSEREAGDRQQQELEVGVLLVALQKMKSREALPVAREVVKRRDVESSVQAEAYKVLLDLNDEEFFGTDRKKRLLEGSLPDDPSLKPWLKNLMKGDPDPSVRDAAGHNLLEKVDESDLDFLIGELDSQDFRAQGVAAILIGRLAIDKKINQRGDEISQKLERMVLDNKNPKNNWKGYSKINAMDAYVDLNGKRSVPLLKKLLTDPDQEVCGEADTNLYRLIGSDWGRYKCMDRKKK